MDKIEELVSKIEIPKGVSIKFAGEREEQKKSSRYLLLSGLLALILVYMVMASLFESLLNPFVIMFTIPFSFIGVVLILFLTGTNFSVPSYMGIIMLVGIVVNNGIVMIDYINRLRGEGMDLLQAVKSGAGRRLRPILITSFTTSLALLPMSLGVGEGSEMWSPLARVVLGGLLVGTLFTLFFVPSLYIAFGSLALKVKARRA
jgi:HAE1 family hydrophobic/amphiphilic exporter-1